MTARKPRSVHRARWIGCVVLGLGLAACEAEPTLTAPVAEPSSSAPSTRSEPTPGKTATGEVPLRRLTFEEVRRNAARDAHIDRQEAIGLGIRGQGTGRVQEATAKRAGGIWIVKIVERGCRTWERIDASTGEGRGGRGVCH